MPTVLITGATGFIGSALCSRLASGNKVIGVDVTKMPHKSANIAWKQADLTKALAVHWFIGFFGMGLR